MPLGGVDAAVNGLGTSIIEPGDIIVVDYPRNIDITLGKWDHAGLYIGDKQIIEATPRHGVRIVSIPDFLSSSVDAIVLRVADASPKVKAKAVQFALEQQGKPYNWSWLKKLHAYSDNYYCSQLVWAAYYEASNHQIDLRNVNSTQNPRGIRPCNLIASKHAVVVATTLPDKPQYAVGAS
jgi:uncharacterized protein YycO